MGLEDMGRQYGLYGNFKMLVINIVIHQNL